MTTADAAGRSARRREAAAPAPAPAGARIGVWQTARRGWRVFLPAILGYAVVQFLLIVPNVTPAVTPLFLTLVAVAYLLDVAIVAASSIAASAGARGISLGEALAPPHRGQRLARIIGWSAVWVAVVSFVAVANAVVAAIILLIGAAVMPAIVAYRGPRAWFRPLRWVPIRTIVWGMLSYIAVVVSAFADAEFGFLLGGPVGAACARVVSGIIGVFILCSSAVLAERAEVRRNAARGGGRSGMRSRAASVRDPA